MLFLNKMPTLRRFKAKRHAAAVDNTADIHHSINLKTPLTPHYLVQTSEYVISDRFVGPAVPDECVKIFVILA